MSTNHWKIGQMPYNGEYRKSFVGAWSHRDNLDNYNKNPNRDAWNDINISYVYNAHGFRCPELEGFVGGKVNIALGCSFTEGIGLPVDRVWPALLETKLECPVLNFGVAGGTTDSVARILTNISTLFDIQTVFILWPMLNRFELYLEDSIKYMQPGIADIEHTWALEGEMCIQRYYKNRLIVEQLAILYGYNVKQYTTLEIIDQCRYTNRLQDTDWARDGSHWGFKTHELIPKMFISN